MAQSLSVPRHPAMTRVPAISRKSSIRVWSAAKPRADLPWKQFDVWWRVKVVLGKDWFRSRSDSAMVHLSYSQLRPQRQPSAEVTCTHCFPVSGDSEWGLLPVELAEIRKIRSLAHRYAIFLCSWDMGCWNIDDSLVGQLTIRSPVVRLLWGLFLRSFLAWKKRHRCNFRKNMFDLSTSIFSSTSSRSTTPT